MRNYLLALVALITIGHGTSDAAVEYRYVADYSIYYGDIGSQVTINLFIQETVTGASQSIIGKDGGIFGAAILVTRINGGDAKIFGTADDKKITPNVANTPSGFGPNPTIVNQKPLTVDQTGLIINADTLGGNGSDGPNIGGGSGAGVNKIFIGSLNITVGSNLTTFVLSNYGLGLDTITQGGTDLDFDGPGYTGASNPVNGLFTFDVAAVPEPSSMALCGLIACGMSYAGYRRRKTASEVVNPAV